MVFFYLGPVYQISWDFWPSLNSPDMRYWVMVWGWVNLLGCLFMLFSYKFTSEIKLKEVSCQIDRKRLLITFFILSAICVFSQIIVMIKFGGLSGVIDAYEMRLSEGVQAYNPYAGFGFLFTFSESFPNILAIFIVYWFKDNQKFKKFFWFGVFIVLLFSINMLFGGLRGSRSTTVWSLFWAVFLYSSVIKKIPLKVMVLGGFLLWSFMSVYSLFKFGGVDGLKGIFDSEIKAQIFESRYIEDGDKLVLARDANRSDVQGYVLKSIFNGEIEYSYGRSLVAGAISFVPSFIISNKPDTFVLEKTEIFWGEWYYSNDTYTTLLTGLFGEFLVNFGPVFGVMYFVLYGCFLGFLSNVYKSIKGNDWRIYLLPVFVLLIIQLLMSDSNVISQYLFRYLFIPGIMILVSLKRKVRENIAPL
jgi:hypothetical protein